MNNEWTNCKDSLPPRDIKLIIVKFVYVSPGTEYYPAGTYCDFIALPARRFRAEFRDKTAAAVDMFFTDYTAAKWKSCTKLTTRPRSKHDKGN